MSDSSSAPDLTHCDDPTATLEKAIQLNKTKTEETPKKKKNIKIDEKLSLDSPDPDGARSKTAKSGELYGGKNLITLAGCKGQLASDLSEKKKWRILAILWFVQITMNLNCSLYSNAIPGIVKQFDRSENAARWGAAVFFIAYAVGCELWAPWSEVSYPPSFVLRQMGLEGEKKSTNYIWIQHMVHFPYSYSHIKSLTGSY